MWVNITKEEAGLLKGILLLGGQHVAFLDLIKKIEEAEKADPADPIYIQQARDDYADPSNDKIEIDDEPAVSKADDGRWVAAWLWVSNDDVEACTSCGAVPGTPDYGTVGDGFNGLCPDCADKAEAKDDTE